MRDLRTRVSIPGLIVLATAAAPSALAQTARYPAPARSAIVEEIAAGGELEPMDYVAPGRVIRLAAGQALVIGYVASCLRETIVGGVVTVGTQRSEVSLTGSWGVGGQGCSLVATRIGD